MTSERKYRNLILGLGTYEGELVPQVRVASLFDEYDSPREILQAFRDCLMELVKKLTGDISEGQCPRCEHKAKSKYAQFCERCGTRLEFPADLNAVAANRFANWFSQQMHEFSDWNFFEDRGWSICQMTSGGYVQVSGFEEKLENWDPKNFEDHLKEGRSWWDSVLANDVTTGEFVVDEYEA